MSLPRYAKKRDGVEKARLFGQANPNWRGGNQKTCERCGVVYVNQSRSKTRRYCSFACYNLVRTERAGPKLPKARRQRLIYLCQHCGAICPNSKKYCSNKCYAAARYPAVYADCQHCGTPFRYSPSTERKFCSYPCFIESGGAQRAGYAATEMIMKKYGAKKDANHKEVMDVIRQFVAVHDLSRAGYGIPDGLAFINDQWELFDIKNPKTSYGKRGLNERQKKWVADWRGGPVYLIHDVDEAQRFAKGDFAGLKRQESGWDQEAA
jgi:hypothetical protein